MKVTYTLDINAPIEKSFECVNDNSKLKLWMDGLEKVEVLHETDPHNPVGTKFRQHIKEGGRVRQYDGEITRYKYPELLSVKISSKAFNVDVNYQFQNYGGGTRLNYEAELTFNNLFARIMSVLFRWLTKGILKKQMATLKKLAES